MAHYLLKWNPRNWSRADFDGFYVSYLSGQPLSWACGGTKRILAGDRFFLLRTGSDPRGIVGAGDITSAPFYDPHYDPVQAEAGKTALYVDIRFDYLAHPDEPIPIPRADLDRPSLQSTIWGVQGSGKQIPPNIAEELERLWHDRINIDKPTGPDEVNPNEGYPEGAVRPVLVNAYERNPAARAECIAYWGARCQVCGFDFEKFYGERGKGYIQVHHLVPISSVGKTYRVDPRQELRPVCANCHAMVHRTIPPMDLDDLKTLVKESAE